MDVRNGRVEVTAYVLGPGDEYTKCTTYIDPGEWASLSMVDRQARIVAQAHAVADRLPPQPVTRTDRED